MLKVDRTSHRTPDVLQGEKARDALARAAEYFGADYAWARQEKFEFKRLFRSSEVKDALALLFSGKCAFCESPIDGAAASTITHHFRPIQEAIDADGSVSRPHYWWLAYEWENLYLACQRCATSAGSQFPVEGERVEVQARGDDLLSERALLVDPCLDDPDEHLTFNPDGTVVPLTERGRCTIEAFGLNRRHLLEARQDAIQQAIREPWNDQPRASSSPYAGAVRQAFARAETYRAADSPRSFPTYAIAYVGGFFRGFSHGLKAAFAAVIAPLRPRTEPLQPMMIESITLRDFRGIEELELRFTDEGTEAPWTVILGENGHSKTSVLQAIALLLMGGEARRRLDIDRDALIRDGAERAEIAAQIRGEPDKRTLLIDRGGGFTPGENDGGAALAAYGAARIPSTHHRPGRGRDGARPRVENLFDAAVPLIDAERWLLDLDQPSFDYAGRALRSLLLKPEGTVMARADGSVRFVTPGGSDEEINRLGDGYRSTFALGTDIMSFFMTRYGSMDAAEGVVLADEISAHLHPSWQMQVVESFREAFPRLQFIVTTHDPLCLRGLRDSREVIVMQRTRLGKVYALPPEDVPMLRGMQVDDLLTSEVFGLSSTLDPEVERTFNRYYELLALHNVDAKKIREMKDLKERLQGYGQLGSTPRERLLLESADEYLADDRNVPISDMQEQLREETKQRLLRIWTGEEG